MMPLIVSLQNCARLPRQWQFHCSTGFPWSTDHRIGSTGKAIVAMPLQRVISAQGCWAPHTHQTHEIKGAYVFLVGGDSGGGIRAGRGQIHHRDRAGNSGSAISSAATTTTAILGCSTHGMLMAENDILDYQGFDGISRNR